MRRIRHPALCAQLPLTAAVATALFSSEVKLRNRANSLISTNRVLLLPRRRRLYYYLQITTCNSRARRAQSPFRVWSRQRFITTSSAFPITPLSSYGMPVMVCAKLHPVGVGGSFIADTWLLFFLCWSTHCRRQNANSSIHGGSQSSQQSRLSTPLARSGHPHPAMAGSAVLSASPAAPSLVHVKMPTHTGVGRVWMGSLGRWSPMARTQALCTSRPQG